MVRKWGWTGDKPSLTSKVTFSGILLCILCITLRMQVFEGDERANEREEVRWVERRCDTPRRRREQREKKVHKKKQHNKRR